MIYDSYIVSQQKQVQKQLQKILELNKRHMQTSLVAINTILENKKELANDIHHKIHGYLKKNSIKDLKKLKKKIEKEFKLDTNGLDIEIFLVDDTYKLVDSTDKKNIGLDLRVSKKAKQSIDSLGYIDDYTLSDALSVDFLEYKVSNYSYSKIKKELYLGVGFIYKEVSQQKKSFDEMREIADADIDLFCVMKDADNRQYFESLVEHKSSHKTSSEYHKSLTKFPMGVKSDNIIIKAARSWKIQKKKKGDSLYIAIPLMNQKNELIEVPGDIVLEVMLDISQENQFFAAIVAKLILFIFMHLALIFIIYYYTTKYHKAQDKLKKQVLKNDELVAYNKNFISNIVHQIRTPLAVIMSNVSMLEIISKNDIKKYTKQINAAINLLSNSYENLSYYISYEDLNYNPKKVDISEFICSRILFFEQIADAQHKHLLRNIKEDLSLEINDIELERLIDNTLSYIISICHVDGDLFVSLGKKDNQIKVSFSTKVTKNIDFKYCKKITKPSIYNISNFEFGWFLIHEICTKNKIGFESTNRDSLFKIEYRF